MIENVIFDVGKVLVEFDWENVMKRLGFDEDTVREVAKATVQSATWDKSDEGILTPEELLTEYISNAPDYEKEIRLFWEHQAETIWKYDYVNEWFAALREAGKKIYILSNFPEKLYHDAAEELSFAKEADGAIFSWMEKLTKPNPAIYERLMSRYGLDAEKSVFIDDRQVNLDGAAKVGIHTLLFTGYEETRYKLEELVLFRN
ncbi:MAG: HAD family phosphatase [Lachnospiraceae bacterium]|nr:HAD family phosphatase [Lachnospiraceae bacterium]